MKIKRTNYSYTKISQSTVPVCPSDLHSYLSFHLSVCLSVCLSDLHFCLLILLSVCLVLVVDVEEVVQTDLVSIEV